MNAPGVMQGSVSESAIWINNLVNGLSGMSFKVKHSVCCESSPFQKIEIYDTYGFGRVLMLAGTVVFTEKDEFIYNEMIVHPVMLMHPAPRKVCIIGGGDGGAAREVLKHGCVESVTVVEIDELAMKLSKAHFPSLRVSFDDPRTTVVIEDGRRYLEKAKEKFDVIIADSYDPGGPVQSITSGPFFPLVAGRLAGGGMAVFLADSPTLCADHVRSTIRHVSEVFAVHGVYVSAIPSFPEGLCSFVVGAAAKEGLDRFDQERYKAIAGSCRCYSRESHQGAFLLPKHVRDMVTG